MSTINLDAARVAVDAARIAFASAVDARSETIRGREAAETAQDALCERRREALIASAADRTNRARGEAVKDIDLQIEHTTNDLRAAAAGDDQAASECARCEATLAEAETEFERAQTSALRRDGSIESEHEYNARRIVEAVETLLDVVRQQTETLAADAALATACGERPRDGTALVGMLIEKLIDAGGRWGGGGVDVALSHLKTALDPINPALDRDGLQDRVRKIVPLILDCLAYGEKHPDADPTNAIEFAAAWSLSFHRAEAIDTLRIFREAQGRERVAREAQDSNDRVARAKAKALQPGDLETETQSGVRGIIKRAVATAKRALSPQEVANIRYAEDRRPGFGGRPPPNTPNGEYVAALDPESPDYVPPGEPAPVVAPPTPLPYGTMRLTPSPRVTLSGPTSMRPPRHETPSATIVGSSGPSRTHEGAAPKPTPSPMALMFPPLPGETILADGMPSTEGPRLPDGSIERVAATSSTRRPKGWRQ